VRETVKNLTGKDPYDLDPEGWYDTKVWGATFDAIEANAPGIEGWAAIKVIGQLVYPTIRTTVGLPAHLVTPLDFVKFEAEGFLQNHRGFDVIPRKILKAEEGEIIMDAPSPGYNCTIIEGVFEGILNMCGVRNKLVKQTQCVKRGDPTCVFSITWSADRKVAGSVDWSIHSQR
jgi:hypothetical protein